MLLLLLSRFSRVWLCDPIRSSPPSSPIPGILQARILEWVAISSSNAWKWKVKVKSLSRVRLFVTPQTAAYQAPPSMGFSRQEYWSGVPLPSPKGGAVHHKEKKKEKVDMAFARTHLFCFLIVHRTILQPFKLSHFLTSPHLRHKISVTIYLTITFAIHTKPTDRGEHKRARHGA